MPLLGHRAVCAFFVLYICSADKIVVAQVKYPNVTGYWTIRIIFNAKTTSCLENSEPA